MPVVELFYAGSLHLNDSWPSSGLKFSKPTQKFFTNILQIGSRCADQVGLCVIRRRCNAYPYHGTSRVWGGIHSKKTGLFTGGAFYTSVVCKRFTGCRKILHSLLGIGHSSETGF